MVLHSVKKSFVNDKPNTKFKSNSSSYFGMKTWNELPKCIINSPLWKVLNFGLKKIQLYNACRTFYILMLLLVLSISCYHLHPPNMSVLINNVSFHIIVFIIVVSRRPHIKVKLYSYLILKKMNERVTDS
mgnify:CR=1 FL=1